MEWHDAYHLKYGGKCRTPSTTPTSPENDDDDNDFKGEIIHTQSTVWKKYDHPQYPKSCDYISTYKNICNSPLNFADQIRHQLITNTSVNDGYLYISFDKLNIDREWVKDKIFPVFKHKISQNISLEMKVKFLLPDRSYAKIHQSTELNLGYRVYYYIMINDNTKNVYTKYEQHKYKQYYSVKVEAIKITGANDETWCNDDNFSFEYDHFCTGENYEFSYIHTALYKYNDIQELIKNPKSNDKFINLYASGLRLIITTSPKS